MGIKYSLIPLFESPTDRKPLTRPEGSTDNFFKSGPLPVGWIERFRNSTNQTALENPEVRLHRSSVSPFRRKRLHDTEGLVVRGALNVKVDRQLFQAIEGVRGAGRYRRVRGGGGVEGNLAPVYKKQSCSAAYTSISKQVNRGERGNAVGGGSMLFLISSRSLTPFNVIIISVSSVK